MPEMLQQQDWWFLFLPIQSIILCLINCKLLSLLLLCKQIQLQIVETITDCIAITHTHSVICNKKIPSWIADDCYPLVLINNSIFFKFIIPLKINSEIKYFQDQALPCDIGHHKVPSYRSRWCVSIQFVGWRKPVQYHQMRHPDV